MREFSITYFRFNGRRLRIWYNRG